MSNVRRPSGLHLLVVCGLVFLVGVMPSSGQSLGSAALQIAGTELVASPDAQTVPFDTPTIVETTLTGYDPARGVLPADLRVVGELSGPEISGSLRLETTPNEPFRIPRFRVQGEYRLDDIRLVQGDEVLGFAMPRGVTINVTQVLITKVSSRAMTQDEIRNYGLVIDEDNYQAFNLTFGFAVKPDKVIEYSVPIVYELYGPTDSLDRPIERVIVPENRGRTLGHRFRPPGMVPFKIDLKKEEREIVDVPKGGCSYDESPCRKEDPPPPPMVGVVMFPSDISLLHQFFAVTLMVQNGAPAGDPLQIRDLTAKMTIESNGLRPAETDPPTPLGVPVPLRVAGPDGRLDTGDDLIIAQATAEAEFLVEGVKEGTHVVSFDMLGTLEGLPAGPQPISGKARGAVVVRDPTLSATLSHPDIVADGEEYSLLVTMTNLGNAPVNDLTMKLPAAQLSNASLAPGQSANVTFGSLLPGEAETAEYRLVAELSGRVIASSVRSPSAIDPTFEFHVGVADGVPLSPESLALPASSKLLPIALRKEAAGLLGLGHSLATAPAALVVGRPQVSRGTVDDRVYRLAQAGRQVGLGDEIFDSAAVLAAEWTGTRDEAWEWDTLRRTTARGVGLAVEMAEVFATEPLDDAFDRFALSNAFLGPQHTVAIGQNTRFTLESRTSGKAMGDDHLLRDLPFAEHYPLDDGALVHVAVPEDGGYRLVLWRDTAGPVDLRVALPPTSPGGDIPVTWWSGVSLAPGDRAEVLFDPVTTGLDLAIDEGGDGTVDRTVAGVQDHLVQQPFRVLAVQQNTDVDPSGHVIDVLFSEDVDLRSLIPNDPDDFQLPGNTSNGGTTPTERDLGGGILGQPEIENLLEGFFNPRIVRVVFSNPLSPYASSLDRTLEVSGLTGVTGRAIGTESIEVPVPANFQPGGAVEGQVIDARGQPLAGALVKLYQFDRQGYGPFVECKRHLTAYVAADAEGRFRFDYVRQTPCSDRFTIKATSPAEPYTGDADGRIRSVGGTQELNIVMLGRGVLSGRVSYDDGSVPEGLSVFVESPIFDEGYRAWVGEDGEYRVAGVPVGTLTLWALDRHGNRVAQTLEMPTAGAEVERDLVMVRRPDAATARLSGRVVDLVTGDPESAAYVTLYVDGGQIDVRRSLDDGTFDFGVVPAGVAELEAFDATTGRKGAQLFFELDPDADVYQELQLRDDRGSVEGTVRRILTDGTIEPVADAVVWVDGTPFNTTTDEQGFYRIDDVLAGTWSVKAADIHPDRQVQTRARVTIGAGTVQTADLYFEDAENRVSRLEGQVFGEDGEPVEGAAVHLAGGYWSTNWHHEAFTDEDGRFVIVDLAPGTYGVHAVLGDSGAIAWATVRYPGDQASVSIRFVRTTISGRTFVTVDGEQQGVVSQLRYRRTEVIEEWGLVAVGRDFEALVTEGDGSFTIDALPGFYEIHATNAFHDTDYRSVRGVVDELGVFREIEFLRNGLVRGVVRGLDGEPVPGVDLTLRGGLFTDYESTSDENGEFLFDLLPPAQYEITARHDDGGIYRTSRIWAQMRRYGDEMDVEIDLPRQGRVEAWVENAAGEPVAGAVVTLKERGFPFRRLVRNTDESGSVSFENIFEGDITVRALAPELGGLGGRANVTLTNEGEDVYAIVRLEGSGEIVGRVISPETGLPVPNAKVRLLKDAYPHDFVDSTNSDGEGLFRFTQLKLEEYRVRVFDPTTGRRGLREGYVLAADGEIVERDVVLEVRGNVRGGLYDPDAGGEGVPGATLQLNSFGLKWFKTYSSTGPEGLYTFEGIPEGDLEIRALTRRRSSTGRGTIEDEDQWLDIDLYLQRQSAVTGKVIGPAREDGTGGEVVDGVNVVLTDYPRDIVGASTENPFHFDDVLPNNLHVLTAHEINGGHKVYRNFAVAPGDTTDVTLQMRAIGSMTIEVYDSQGVPVPGAEIHAFNRYSFLHDRPSDAWSPEGKSFDGSTGADHVIHFDGVRQGPVQVGARDPLTDVRGAGYGVLRFEDQDLQIRVDLQPTGTIRGQIFEADGITPSVGAQIAVDLDGIAWDWVFATTDEEGRFEIADLPIEKGAYHLVVQDADGPGSWEQWKDFTYDQEIHDYTIVLDEEDPRVVSVTPLSGTRDLPRSTGVTITFSEPMRCGGCFGEAVYVAKLTGYKVAASYTWNADKTQLTIQPNSLLANNTGYKIVVDRDHNLRRLTDSSLRAVAWRHLSSFYTADELPPKVIEIQPRNGADQVPVDSGIQIRFDEPVSLDSLSGAFTVVDTLTGSPFTLTTLNSLDDRAVTLTPVGGFAPDQHVEVTVTGVEDPAGNRMTAVVTSSFWTPDATPPTITVDAPLVGQSFTAGDPIEVVAQVTDNRAVERVTFRLDEWSKTLDAPPWRWDVPAPIRAQVGPATVIVEAEDRYGNVATAEREVSVTPLDNAVPPSVTAGCPVDLDFVAPGIELVVTAPVADDLAVESAWLTVGVSGETGVEVDRETPIDQADHAATLRWTPPIDAVPGTSFALVLHTRDFAGNVATLPLTVSVPVGEILVGDQALDPVVGLGADLYLADGTFSFGAPLTGGSVTLLQGARFEADGNGADLDLDALHLQCDASGRFETVTATTEIVVESGSAVRPRQLRALSLDTARLVVEADATIDAYGLGYEGYNDDPRAPSWVSYSDSGGGSHGGVGSFYDTAGEVFDSVYWPTLGGGGSSRGQYHTQPGSDGGGIVEIRADEVVLDGTIDIRGDFRLDASGAAGGSVAIDAGRLEGAGTILGRGGDTNCLPRAGGGGRVALWFTELVGFDVATQVDVRGGAIGCADPRGPGGAGTLFVHGPDAAGQAATYGDLVIDNSGRAEAPQTVLPALGDGDVTGVQVSGSDAWILSTNTFRPRWQGAWVRLENAAGGPLGTFRVLAEDGDRLLLEGAATVPGASRFVGIYRFDDLTLVDARLRGTDPVEVAGRLEARGESRIDVPLESIGHFEISAGTALETPRPIVAGSMTVGEGASLSAPDGRIELEVAGRLEIAAGALLDTSGQGYEGGGKVGESLHGDAPDGVTGSLQGGSHGGLGRPGSGVGAAYGSLYRPVDAGAGGGGRLRSAGPPHRGGWGGGVIRLVAGELVLDGELRAHGFTSDDDSYRGGAGGTISIEAGSLEGSGTIRANGGDDRESAGGGGRIALRVDDLTGFDPLAQVEARGGFKNIADPFWGGAGTVFVRDAAATWGTLIVDGGIDSSAGSASPAVGATPLLPLGEGAPASLVVDGSDLRLSTSTTLDGRWWGAWVALEDAAGGELGVFEVITIDGDILVLEGAASVIGQVATYRGVYRFDTIRVEGGGKLTFDADTDVETTNLVVGSEGRIDGELASDHLEIADGETADLSGPVRVDSMRIGAGALVRSTSGEIDLDVAGTLEIAAGAVLDVSGEGHRGGYDDPNDYSKQRGGTPDGVQGSREGGSHGGYGAPGSDVGEIYGSVYRPIERGSGGGITFFQLAVPLNGGEGGGRVAIRAGEVLFDGEIRADGVSGGDHPRGGYRRGGAGGTVSIETDRLVGSGTIRANGGDGEDSAGGGGRVAFHVDDLSLFDVPAQVEARGGRFDGSDPRGGAGTIYVFDAASTWGRLLVSSDAPSNPAATPLPRIDDGTIGVAEVDADDPTALWVEPAAGQFPLGVVGMWLRIAEVDYRILAEAGDRQRVLLDGAAGVVQVGDAYEGVYKFDQVEVRGEAWLKVENVYEVPVWTVDPSARLDKPDLDAPTDIVPVVGPATEGLPTDLVATFLDVGGSSSFTATVDWGDGSPVQSVPVTVETDGGSLAASHVYLGQGDYAVEVCVTDTDSNTGCDSVLVSVANAVPRFGWQDLHDWTPENVVGNAGEWHVSTGGSWVRQVASSGVHALLSPFPALGSRVSGYLQSEGTDLDPIGFFVGYRPGDTAAADADYLVAIWSKTDWTEQRPGLRVYRVRGALSNYWDLDGASQAELLAESTTFSTTGFADFRDYAFTAELTASRFRLWIDGGLELDVPGDFSTLGGRFAFYEYSHPATRFERVRVSAAESTPSATLVPELPLVEPIDLRDFTEEEVIEGPNGSANWVVKGNGQRVEQRVESRPSFFFDDEPLAFRRVHGTLQSTSDSEYIGLVFGYEPGDNVDPNADYLLMVWRKSTSGSAYKGLRVYRVSGVPSNFWAFDDQPTHFTKLADSVTWGDSFEHWIFEMDAHLEADRFRLWVNDILEIDVAGDFSTMGDGRFGFFVNAMSTAYFTDWKIEGTLIDEGDEMPRLRASGFDLDAITSAEARHADGTVATAAVDAGPVYTSAIVEPHVYTDDVYADGEVCLTDADGGTGCAALPVRVRNVAPSVDAGPGASASVGESFVLAGATFTDPGADDTHTATVDWGDGSAVETASVDSALGTISASHVYAAIADVTVTVCVTDDDGASACDDTVVTVAGSTPPSSVAATVSPTAGSDIEGSVFGLAASFLDVDAGDVHTATVDWGDGSAIESVPVTATSDPAGGTLAAAHVYLDDGTFPVTVCVTDAAAGTGCGSTAAVVQNAAPRLGPVDFTTWTVEEFEPPTSSSAADPDWQIFADGSQAQQWTNADASVLYSDFPVHGSRLVGRLRINHADENDYAGFAIGFEPGDATNPDADYLLVTWKGAAEGNNPVGLRIYRVRGVPTDFWRLDLDPAATLLATGSTLGGSTWQRYNDYRFEVEATADRVRLWVDGSLQIDLAADPADPFPNGRLGLYTHANERTWFREWYAAPAGDLAAETLLSPFVTEVDFRTWTNESLYAPGAASPAQWNVYDSGARVEQHVNSGPSVFYDDRDLHYGRVTGIMQFLGDDDVGGLIFGYTPGEAQLAEAHYVMIEWAGSGETGVRAYRLRGPMGNFRTDHERLAEGRSTAWTAGPPRFWTAEYAPDRLRFWIDGALELDIVLDLAAGDDPFPDGRFGLFTHFQEGLRFFEFERRGTAIDEGETTPPIALGWADLGVTDVHTATVDWGDGTPVETIAGAVGSITGPDGISVGGVGGGGGGILLEPRVLEDDVLGGAEVCVTDNSGASACTPLPIRARNVAPSVDAGPDADTSVGQSFPLASTFTDSGAGDTHAATVDWGDGSAVETASVDSALGTVSASHVYAATGDVTVTVCVTDDDGGNACDTATISVGAGAPIAGPPVLTLTKTDAHVLDLDADGRVDAGDRIAYTLDVANVGESTATSVAVHDDLPIGAVFVAGSETSTRGFVTVNVDEHGDERSLDVSIGDLGPGETASASFTVELVEPLPLDLVELVNQATATGNTATGDALAPVLSDDPATAPVGDATVTPVAAAGATSFCADDAFDADDGSLDAAWTLSNLGDADEASAEIVADVVGGVVRVAGDGSELYDAADHGGFLHRTVEGDFRAEIDVAALALDGGGAYRKGCLAVRSSLDPWAARAMACYVPGHPEGSAFYFLARTADGAAGEELASIVIGASLPVRLALVRRGDVITASYRLPGGEWIEPLGALGNSAPIALGDTPEVGLLVSAYDSAPSLAVDFDDWRLCHPNDELDPIPPVPACDAQQPLDVVYLLDLSESMDAAFPDATLQPLSGETEASKLAAARRVLERIHDQVELRADGSRAALATFYGARDVATNLAGTVRVEAAMTSDLPSVGQAIADLGPSDRPGLTTTPTGLALEELAELLAASHDPSQVPGHRPVVVLVTDGVPNVDRAGRGNEHYVLSEIQGIDLRAGDGGFRPWTEVAWLGQYNDAYDTFDGETLAGAMFALDRLASTWPDLALHAVGLPGSGAGLGTFHRDLVEYAAWVGGGLSSMPATVSELDASADAVLGEISCGVAATATIGDRVWNDLDADGTIDPGEPGLAGVRVVVEGTGAEAGTEVASATTTADGGFQVRDLPPATYTVRVDGATLPGGVGEATHDADGTATPGAASVTVAAYDVAEGVDFGYRAPVLAAPSAPAATVCALDGFDDPDGDGLPAVEWSLDVLGALDPDLGSANVVGAPSDGGLELTSNGDALWGDDRCHFLSRPAPDGDFRFEVGLEGYPVDPGGSRFRKAGPMVRAGLGEHAPRVMAQVAPDYETPAGPAILFGIRDAQDATVGALSVEVTGQSVPIRLAIERRAGVYGALYSSDGGATWQRETQGSRGGFGVLDTTGADPLRLGLAVASYDSLAPMTATFDDVAICQPIEPTAPTPSTPTCDAQAPVDVVVVLDASGSAASAFPGGPDRLGAARQAIDRLATLLAGRGDGSRAALLVDSLPAGASLEEGVRVLAGLGDPSRVAAATQALVEAAPAASHGSVAAVALRRAAALLADAGAPGHRGVIVWITDGPPSVRLDGLVAAAENDPIAADVSLSDGAGGFLSWPEAAWRGPLVAAGAVQGGSKYAGQASAEAMVELDAARVTVPGLAVHALGLDGDGTTTPVLDLDLLDYSAWLTGGSARRAVSTTDLLTATDSMWLDLTCQGAP